MIQPQQNASNVYTDINALQGIRKLGQENKDAALMEVAKQFESMFLNMMLSSMREANKVFKEDSLFESPEMEFYEKMYDDQLGLTLSSGQGMGLASVMYKQLKSNYNADVKATGLDQNSLFGAPVGLPMQNDNLQRTIKDVERERQINNLRSTPPEPASQAEKTPPKEGTPVANGSGDKRQQFASPSEFVAALYPHAETVAKELNVDPRAIVAQAALETGWGKYLISDEKGNNSFNFFGIKADQRWGGEKVVVTTHEFRHGSMLKENAAFRAYPSLEEGLRDYAKFLQSGERYQQAINQGLDAENYGHALQQAGYATDPQYGNKIQRISSSSTLQQALNELQSTAPRGE